MSLTSNIRLLISDRDGSLATDERIIARAAQDATEFAHQAVQRLHLQETRLEAAIAALALGCRR